jgi:NAD(P)-dependent dehydrogenase (short-subunit alcohol dehydrogenase family)
VNNDPENRIPTHPGEILLEDGPMKKTVLVTGGSSGIGTAIVKLFAEKDFRVLFTYNSRKESAQKIVEQLEPFDVQMFHFSQGNLSSQEALLAKLPDRIDVLINNAAVGSATVKRISDDRFVQDRKMFEINALGVLWLTEAIIPKMTENGGKIINISSVGGGIFHFPGFLLADGMSKAALTFMTKQLAAEHAHTKIDVFAICPGATDTDMFQSSTLNKLSDDQRKAFVEALPKKRLIHPGEVALICEFLSQEHSTVMHGAVIDCSLGLGVSPGMIKK